MGHGGNVHEACRILGIGLDEVMDFSASINPLGMPDGVAKTMAINLLTAVHYPDPEAGRFSEAVSNAYGIDKGKVICANGSTELIFLIPRALRPENVLIPYPTFSEYERASLLAGASIKRICFKERDSFMPDFDEYIGAMKGTDLAFLCNPGNPSGKAVPKDGVMEIALNARKYGCTLVLDEAFVDFCPEHSVINEEFRNVIVLRSLTKFYAMAGLRAGFLKASRGMVKKLLKFKEPWTVNALAELSAAQALGDTQFARKTRKLIAREKKYMEKRLDDLQIKYFPSDVNYYLLRIDDAAILRERLFDKGIIVRDCSDFRGLGRKLLRVAVRRRAENKRLMDEISRLL
jgi:threonine-phosphate decarboxylase